MTGYRPRDQTEDLGSDEETQEEKQEIIMNFQNTLMNKFEVKKENQQFGKNMKID